MRVFELFDDNDKGVNEEKQRLDPKCWTGYKKQGTKMKGGVRVNNCVPKEGIGEGDRGITKDQETKFHAKLDKLVHDTFGKRKEEMSKANEAVNMDRSRNPNYPNDPATQKHRLDTAKSILSDPNSDPDSRREAAAIVARLEPKGKA